MENLVCLWEQALEAGVSSGSWAAEEPGVSPPFENGHPRSLAPPVMSCEAPDMLLDAARF